MRRGEVDLPHEGVLPAYAAGPRNTAHRLIMWARRVRQHWWKLFLIPVFFDVPDAVRYACAAIVLASLVFDVYKVAKPPATARSSRRE
jgi:hypothetical protein